MNYLRELSETALSEAPSSGAKSKGYDPMYLLCWNYLALSECRFVARDEGLSYDPVQKKLVFTTLSHRAQITAP